MPTHARITLDDLADAKAAHPDAISLAHPECGPEVRAAADKLLSTGQMLSFAKKSDAKSFIIATEIGIIHALKKENPGKEFIEVSQRAVCPNMKKITLEKVAWALEDMKYVITVDKETAIRAKLALDRMLEVLPAQ